MVVKNSQVVSQSNHPLHILKEITRCSLRTGNILQYCTDIRSSHMFAFISNDFQNYIKKHIACLLIYVYQNEYVVNK